MCWIEVSTILCMAKRWKWLNKYLWIELLRQNLHKAEGLSRLTIARKCSFGTCRRPSLPSECCLVAIVVCEQDAELHMFLDSSVTLQPTSPWTRQRWAVILQLYGVWKTCNNSTIATLLGNACTRNLPPGKGSFDRRL